MKAVIQSAYGEADVLSLQSVNKPQPKKNEILVRIVASSVTTADTMMRRGTPLFGRVFLGLLKPRFPIPGTGFSGVVESVGVSVTTFSTGDAVFGESVLGAGTNAEYVCVAEDGVVAKKPDVISHAEAAPVCDGAMTSMYMLETLGGIKAGDSILVNGAAGSLGSAAVQLAHLAGAHVTGVCSRRNARLVRVLGAERVIDYNETDVTGESDRYDLIYDSVGKLSYRRCRRILNPAGRYVSPVLGLSLLFSMAMSRLWKPGSKRALFAATGLLPEPKRRSLLQALCKRLESGSLKVVVDRHYSLADIVDAHQYLDSGHKRANVVIDVM